MHKHVFRTYTLQINSKKSRKIITSLAWFVAIVFVVTGLLVSRSTLLEKTQRETLTASAGADAGLSSHPSDNGNGLATESLRPTFFSYLMYLMTDINFHDVSSLLNWQIPMMNVSQVQLISGGADKPGQGSFVPPKETDPTQSASMSRTMQEHAANTKPAGGTSTANTAATTDQNPEVYIYHTHNREAYLPELHGVTQPDDAYDAKINITRYGDTLVQDLKQLGVSSIHTTNDYWTMGPYWNAYKYSRQTVKQVLKQHPGLKMILDIHRDSEPKSVTTTIVKGAPTAGIYFIIGGMNPHHDENERLANALKNQMDQEYPGLCRGIWRKTSTQYDTIYNQDLSPNSVLIEIGGPYNTPDELNRAVDDLSHVIADVLKKEK
ncbi:stage II sporulation protein P [Fodinisporobacter ferrooxydans]|uniref:Stage II sporulation protein P n=1 Tax=Fodinisporobacter ferrooxydans TaxID=2901836 RepID=A0ABY4CEF4_9BACL|nr:stage II sporulation protein P [Alicyclobacillaceae bacterium MYW30-H2]